MSGKEYAYSVALLMPDGTVFSGGGGLCNGCSMNHFDAQIWSPPYLFNADGSNATRPVISNAPATIAVGATFTVTTADAVSSWSLIRMGTVTHAVNTDQRRLPIVPTATDGTTYTFTLPADPGVALPGMYMLFAINEQGTPSMANTVQITL